MVFHSGLGHQLACHYQCFLVGQGDGFSAADGAVNGFQTGHAHNARQHDVDAAHLHNVAQRRLPGEHLDVIVPQGVFHLLVQILLDNDHCVGLELLGLADKQVCIGVARKNFNFKQIR